MRSKKLLFFSVLAIFSLVLAACTANSPESNTPAINNPVNENTQPNDVEENEPEANSSTDDTQEETIEITPSVSVSDQDASGGTVTVDEVVAAQLGWMVIHADSDGAPGPVIGFSQVQEGTNTDVSVEIDLDAATETLFAMLHVDTGTAGTYEFPGDDGPVRVNDAVVVTPFTVTLLDSAMDDTMGETADNFTVMIGDSFFDERDITVKAGTTVTWVMDANFPHTVTADDGSFDSGRLSNGESFSITFDQAGEFPYYCSIHGGPGGAGMAGTVTVTE